MNLNALFETAHASSSRLTRLDPAARRSAPGSHPMAVVTLDPTQSFQEIVGFGAALTEATNHVLGYLSDVDREQVLAAHFGPEGHGYTLARSHLDSCDFSLAPWSMVPEAGDTALRSFSMETPDRVLVPLIRAAARHAEGGLRLMITPWSPPAWMKSNQSRLQGGKLLPEYRAAWAETFVRYLKELRERGIEVWSVSIQNEPAAVQRWDSCEWTAQEEAEFAVAHLKPRLTAAGFDHVKILVWDHNRDLLWERAQASLGEPGALEAIDGLAVHWYSGDQYDQVAACAQAWPDKLLVFTEGCIEGGPRPGAWYSGERYAHNIFGDLRAGMHAWIDWNLALDWQGGPNHASNFCDAPVLVDPVTKTAHYQSSYWYLGHFSRFVRPGARRISTDLWVGWVPASPDGRGGGMVEALGFRNLDSSVVLVIMNRTEAALPYVVRGARGEESLTLPPRAIHTLTFR